MDAKLASALEYKGSKDTYAELPTEGNKKGDVWNIVNADTEHGVKAGDNTPNTNNTNNVYYLNTNGNVNNNYNNSNGSRPALVVRLD